MKLRIAIIICLLTAGLGGWFLLHSSSAAPSSTQLKLYLSPSRLAVEQGQTFSEAVRLSKSGNEKVDYVSAQLTFPAQLVTVKSVNRSGSAFNNGTGLRVTYSNSSGTLSATGSGNALGNPADVLVVTITFVAKTAGQANLKFSTASQAGALLGNNSVKNALDTMVGSVVTVAASTSGSSSTSNSGSSSTSNTPPTDSTAKNEPAITTPDAQPNSISVLNESPRSNDTTDTTSTAAKSGEASQSQPWGLWLLAGGIIAVIFGALAIWLAWLAKHPVTTEDSKIVSPQSTDTTDNTGSDVVEIQAAALADADNNDTVVQTASESKDTSVQTTAAMTEPVSKIATTPVTQPDVPVASAPAAETTTVPSSASVAAKPTPKTSASLSTSAAVNSPATPVASSAQSRATPGNDAVPDMFEDGEKRLKSEGL
jgi:hypothetical protein